MPEGTPSDSVGPLKGGDIVRQVDEALAGRPRQLAALEPQVAQGAGDR